MTHDSLTNCESCWIILKSIGNLGVVMSVFRTFGQFQDFCAVMSVFHSHVIRLAKS